LRDSIDDLLGAAERAFGVFEHSGVEKLLSIHFTTSTAASSSGAATANDGGNKSSIIASIASSAANDTSLIAFIDELNAKSLQNELTTKSATSDDNVERLVDKLQRRPQQQQQQQQQQQEFYYNELAARLLVERAHFLHYYRYERQMRAATLLAARAARLRISLTGQIGRRTKFQRLDIAQLVLSVEREADIAATSTTTTDAAMTTTTTTTTTTTNDTKPKTIILDDDTRLDQIEYAQSSTSASSSTATTTSSSSIQLRPVERALVLAMSASHAMRGARHAGGIGTDELRAFIDRALDLGSPADWTVHTWSRLLKLIALFVRSLNLFCLCTAHCMRERKSTRTVIERWSEVRCRFRRSSISTRCRATPTMPLRRPSVHVRYGTPCAWHRVWFCLWLMFFFF
jgi:hypothetical protein